MQVRKWLFFEILQRVCIKRKEILTYRFVSKENDTLYVYHSEASELTGVGFVKREKLDLFLSGIKTFGFFEFTYPNSIKNEILRNTKQYYSAKTPFDISFNSFCDNELYCTELIAVSINRALNVNEIKPSLVLNGKVLYALDDIYSNTNVKEISLSIP